MNLSVGVNLDKIIGKNAKKVKIPAITQKQRCTNYHCNHSNDDYDDYEEYEEIQPYCNFDINVKKVAFIGLGVVAGMVGVYLISKRR